MTINVILLTISSLPNAWYIRYSSLCLLKFGWICWSKTQKKKLRKNLWCLQCNENHRIVDIAYAIRTKDDETKHKPLNLNSISLMEQPNFEYVFFCEKKNRTRLNTRVFLFAFLECFYINLNHGSGKKFFVPFYFHCITSADLWYSDERQIQTIYAVYSLRQTFFEHQNNVWELKTY